MAKVVRKEGPARSSVLRFNAGVSGLVGKAGWFPSAQYEDGTPVAYVATIQEFGHGAIPPRSFMRTTQAEKQNQWRQVAAHGAKMVLSGVVQPSDALDLLAQTAAGDMRKKITQITSPALAEATILARRRRNASGEASNKPLVDTGIMLATLTATVEPK